LGYFVFGCLIFCALCTFWIFICWTAGEDFLPSSGLSLDSGNCFLWCAEFLIWCSSICPFLLLFPGQLESYSENNYLRLCLPELPCFLAVVSMFKFYVNSPGILWMSVATEHQSWGWGPWVCNKPGNCRVDRSTELNEYLFFLRVGS
jgi:hypothetical protein